MDKVYYSLYDRMLSYGNLDKAFCKVKTAKGAAGIDGSILNLVRMFLTSGVMENNTWQASTEGSPQGGLCKVIDYAK